MKKNKRLRSEPDALHRLKDSNLATFLEHPKKTDVVTAQVTGAAQAAKPPEMSYW